MKTETPVAPAVAQVRPHANAPALEVRNLQKRYRDGTYAVQGVSFAVQKGEIFGLLGPNGAGKTTAMHVLGTLHRATSGGARVLGMDVQRDAKAIRRRIGFAMQDVGIDDLATAEEMLHFHARLHGIPMREAKRRATELLETFDLVAHRKRRVTAFSGGMQRRLDLAVSLIHDPDVLFLDEPTTGLDPHSRTDLWNILRRLTRDRGLTVLMSTHYMEEADQLCDRIAIMNEGRIAAIDTPERLKRSVGADTIRVRLGAAPTTEQQKALQSHLKGAPAKFHDGVLEVRVRDGGESLLPLLRLVDGAGLKVSSTRVLTPSLDDAFHKYTGKRLEPDALEATP